MYEPNDTTRHPEEMRRIEPSEAEQIAGGAAYIKYDGLRPAERPTTNWIDVLS